MARFPVLKSLDQFDFTALPCLNKARVLDLAQGGYLEKRENLSLMGNSGTGKTYLATALGLLACQQGRKVRFFTAAGLIHLLTEAQAGLRLSHLDRNLAQRDLLIIDATGRARPALHNLDTGRPSTLCPGRRLAGSVGLAINQVGPW